VADIADNKALYRQDSDTTRGNPRFLPAAGKNNSKEQPAITARNHQKQPAITTPGSCVAAFDIEKSAATQAARASP
jgi:hypothetical protein